MGRRGESAKVQRMLGTGALLTLVATAGAFAQTSIIDQPWSGWAQCQITVQGPNSYNYSETQTWTLDGSQPTVQGAMRIHPGTWKVVGRGSFSKVQGPQTYDAQWATNATQANAPLALFVRASDGMLILKSAHSQLTAPGAMTGTQKVSFNGAVQSQGVVSFTAYEYAVPTAQTSSTSTSINGSTTAAISGSAGPMQPGGSQGTAACTWQFAAGRDGVTSSPPASGGSTGTPGTGIGTNPGGASATPAQASSGADPFAKKLVFTSVSPTQGYPGDTLTFTFTGQYFVPGEMVASFGPGIGSPGNAGLLPTEIDSVHLNVTSSTSATAQMKINPQAAAGTRTVSLSKLNTGAIPNIYTALADVFTVLPSLGVNKPQVPGATDVRSCPPPWSTAVVAATPDCVYQGQKNVTMILTAVPPFQWPQGTYDYFKSPTEGVTITSRTWNSPTTLTQVIDVDAGATLGQHAAFMPLPNNTVIDLGSYFTVVSAPSSPLLTSSTAQPANGGQTLPGMATWGCCVSGNTGADVISTSGNWTSAGQDSVYQFTLKNGLGVSGLTSSSPLTALITVSGLQPDADFDLHVYTTASGSSGPGGISTHRGAASLSLCIGGYVDPKKVTTQDDVVVALHSRATGPYQLVIQGNKNQGCQGSAYLGGL